MSSIEIGKHLEDLALKSILHRLVLFRKCLSGVSNDLHCTIVPELDHVQILEALHEQDRAIEVRCQMFLIASDISKSLNFSPLLWHVFLFTRLRAFG